MAELDISSIVAYWTDEKTMRAYYDAICVFRKLFEEVYKQIHEDKRESCGNGFSGWPTPNPCFQVSMKGIFLSVNRYKGEVKSLGDLYTPFGQVKILGGGLGSTISKIAQKVYDRLGEICELIDVSDLVHLHNLNLYKGEKVYHDYKFQKECQYTGDHTLYLLKFKGDQEFTQTVNIPEQDLHIFSSVNASWDEGFKYESKNFMKKFSEGAGCFKI